MFFATGEGQTVPKGEDGRLNEFTRLEDFPRPQAPFSVTIGGQPAEILFAGGAPGFLAGLMQFNVKIPASAADGDVAVKITVGGLSTQDGATIPVKK